jgi:dihydrolipoamide dehydrogenase
MADQPYDLVVIGSGPGGYVAALRAAQLGLSVACVEKDASLGGTCLNIGCIPSKALLHTSEQYAEVKAGLDGHGIVTEGVTLDLDAMMDHKDEVVETLTKGIAGLFKKAKVARLEGIGRIEAPGVVTVTAGNGETSRVEATSILIATGSVSTPLPGVEIDEERIVTSTGALDLAAVPEHLVVLGAGFIGLEMGSVWARLGARVTVVEMLDAIAPGMDGEVIKHFQRLLKRQGLEFRLGTKASRVERQGEAVELTLEPREGGESETLNADVVLVAVGRRPFTEGLGLEAAGVATEANGRIAIDENFRTSVAGLYAIGDVVRGPMLAHKAMDEGAACAEIIAGQKAAVNYAAIPGVVYTAPEAASVGKTEEELKAEGVDYTIGKFPFLASGRARAMSKTDGFVKILADATTDRVLGVHILGHEAGTMIAEAVLAMEMGASAEDIALTCHAHPSLAEAMKEAALAAGPGALHI